MGISGINKLLKSYAPKAFFKMHISDLYGKRVAIDACNWMYNNMSIARKRIIEKNFVCTEKINEDLVRKEWFNLLIGFILRWTDNNVTPVFIFDGEAPKEKKEIKEKRRLSKTNTKKKIDSLYEKIGDGKNVTESMISDLKKELRNYNVINGKDFNLFKEFIHGIGIPSIQAVSECEHLCSMLCVEGKVAAVFSSDTDNLVYGCPLMITKMVEYNTHHNMNKKTIELECVRLDNALSGLNISHPEYVDLCILCGCDYNTAIITDSVCALELIQKYKSIDLLPSSLNIEATKHIRCRELFYYVHSKDLILPSLLLPNRGYYDMNRQSIPAVGNYVKQVHCEMREDRIKKSLQRMIHATDGGVPSLFMGPPIYNYPNKNSIDTVIVDYKPKKMVVNLMIPKVGTF
jgi:flap endonuclease-1